MDSYDRGKIDWLRVDEKSREKNRSEQHKFNQRMISGVSRASVGPQLKSVAHGQKIND